MTRRYDHRDDYAEEGLPVAEDYEPDALGSIETRAGQPEQTWPEFGLELVPVEYKSMTQDEWSDTGRRMVVRNGKELAFVSDDYKLLPNEHLVGVANDVARDLDAIPFHEFDGDWFATLDDHVFQDEERRRVHAVYSWEQGEIGGDDMEYGFAVHNSIDGSLSFSVGLFTFRNACKNMVFMGAGGRGQYQALGVEQEREILQRHQHAHTSGLDVDADALEATIKGTVMLIDDVDATYESWLTEQVTPEDVRDLVQRPQLAGKDLPEWVDGALAAVEDVQADEYADEDEEMPWEEKAAVIEAEIPSATNVWETYNDVTEMIWKRGSASDTTRRSKMKSLHQIFDPVEKGEHSGVTVR